MKIIKLMTIFYLVLFSALIGASLTLFNYSPGAELLDVLDKSNKDYFSFSIDNYSLINYSYHSIVFEYKKTIKHNGLYSYCYFPTFETNSKFPSGNDLNNFQNRLVYSNNEELNNSVSIIAGSYPAYNDDALKYSPSLLLSKEIADSLISSQYPNYQSLIGKALYVKPSFEIEVFDIDVNNYRNIVTTESNPYFNNFANSLFAESALSLNVISGIYESDIIPTKMGISRSDHPFYYYPISTNLFYDLKSSDKTIVKSLNKV